MNPSTNAATAGVADALRFWLSQHDVSFPLLLQAAANEAITEWLNDHTDELIEAIALQAKQ